MFGIDSSEMLIIAIIALVVIGPKDLPKAMRFVGHWVGKARGMARHFRSGIDTMMREAELQEMEAKWRAHNEAIMSAYPDLGTGPPMISPTVPFADPVAAPAVAPPEAMGTGPLPVMQPLAPAASVATAAPDGPRKATTRAAQPRVAKVPVGTKTPAKPRASRTRVKAVTPPAEGSGA